MAKRRRKAGTKDIVDKSKEEQTDRIRATNKRYYQKRRSHPELREKKRLQTAQRRAEKKAAKRRWDPPKKSKPEVEEHERSYESASITDELRVDSPHLGAHSQTPVVPFQTATESGAVYLTPTPAEQIAMLALAELAQGQISATSNDEAASGPALARQVLSTRSSAIHSGLALARQVSSTRSSVIQVPVEVELISGAAQQVSHRGITPSSRVHAAQMMVAELNSGPMTLPTAAEATTWGDNYAPVPPYCTTMGSNRWDEYYYWSEAVIGQNEWDRPAQLAFARAGKTGETTSEIQQLIGRQEHRQITRSTGHKREIGTEQAR
ncbi:hypothetical protein FB451DRAFT_1172060 [Mycena latifolia]|nr:hypothetical protein FB451DRAFT_1172060 [Mycena latifolia]